MATFDESTETPSLTEAFRNAFDESMLEVRVALPAKVVSYDADTRTVSVTPLVGRYVRATDGTEKAEALPVLNSVPVAWLGGGGAEATFPLAAGDTGELSFHDSSLDEWAAADNQPVIAKDIRSHALTDAVFRPGLRSPGGAGNAPRTDAAVFGYATAQTGGTHAVHVTPGGIALGEANPAYFVALAEQVLAALQDIATKFNNHTHGTSNGPSGTPDTGAPPLSISAPSSVGSATVKVKG